VAAGEIDYTQFMDTAAASAPSAGHCNTMGTASSMNALAEALGMSLTGCAIFPAPYRERAQIAYDTGYRIVGMVEEGLAPLASRDEIETRRRHRHPAELIDETPWQEIYRRLVGSLSEGACVELGLKFRDIVGKHEAPRHSH
jgi:dihydroxyacid dehydratase/phosphogluconate dehydratase